MRKIFKITAMLLVLTPITALATPIVYDNGLPEGQGGNEMTNWIQAEDFVLSSRTLLTSMTFWSLEDFADSFLGTIAWQIYSNRVSFGDNEPDHTNTIASGIATPTRTLFETFPGVSRTSYRYDFPIAATLQAGVVYWIGIHNGPLDVSDRKEMYWRATRDNTTDQGQETMLPYEPDWDTSEIEHAYQLRGTVVEVPEPPTLALVLIGLLGMGLSRRRKKV